MRKFFEENEGEEVGALAAEGSVSAVGVAAVVVAFILVLFPKEKLDVAKALELEVGAILGLGLGAGDEESCGEGLASGIEAGSSEGFTVVFGFEAVEVVLSLDKTAANPLNGNAKEEISKIPTRALDLMSIQKI